MTITVDWDNPQNTVIRYTFEGRWTWQEYYAAIQKGVQLINGIPYHVNMIIDMSEGNLVPENLLSRVIHSMQTPPAEYDLAVIVTKSRFIENLFAIVSKVNSRLGKKHPVVRTIDEARAILAEHATNAAQNAVPGV